MTLEIYKLGILQAIHTDGLRTDLLSLNDKGQRVEDWVEQESFASDLGGWGYGEGMGRLQDRRGVHHLLSEVEPGLQELNTTAVDSTTHGRLVHDLDGKVEGTRGRGGRVD